MTPEELLAKWDAAKTGGSFKPFEFEDSFGTPEADYLAAAANMAPELARKAIRLRNIAGHFVPSPRDMSGYDDADAPEEVKRLIALAEEFWKGDA